MINLLPNTYKQQVKKLYRVRMTVVVLWLLVGVLIVMTGFLIPSYVLSSAKERSVIKERETLAQEYSISGVSDFEAEIETLNKYATYFPQEELISQQVSTIVIKPVHAAVPNSVSVRALAYQHTGEAHQVDISGIATSRDAVLTFVQALEAVPHFAEVALPVQNLAPNEDISFRIEFIASQPEQSEEQ